MAYINVAEWTPDQVTDWLKGLDDSMYNYIYSFTNNEVGGQQLLNIRPYELEELGMHSIGHQEIVLEAVEHLRNFHYNLDKENLQYLALHVATAAKSLCKQLDYYCDKSKIETQILNDITRTIATIKPVIGWLDRSPFQGQLQFNEICKNMLRLGLEMATSAQRDRFVENPVDQIRMTAEKLAKLADYIIQDISDPMLLQPASLNLVTLKKRESELGFNIVPSFHGVHRVSDIKYNSPAHNSGKIEDGDEIVQINYQTVVGWQYKTVILQLRESPPDVLLTLKKRPKHTKIYGQIYMQPYRLPSKKRAPPGRWGENQPSPRANFLPVQDFTLPLKINEKHNASDTDSSCSDILTPTDSKSVDKEMRLYLPKPRAVLQRRKTICGDELSYLKNSGNIPLWHERKSGQNGEASPNLRDKSVSFGFGLEITPRPTTCLGISAANGKLDLIQLNNSSPEINAGNQSVIKQTITKSENDCGDGNESAKPGISKVVRFDANMRCEDYPIDNEYICNVENTILETFEPIPYVDDDDVPPCRELVVKNSKNNDNLSENGPVGVNKMSNQLKQQPSNNNSTQQSFSKLTLNTAIGTSCRRGRLDKSHSTPAYDNSDEDSDTPPAIEPRKEIATPPPAPPPRPKRQAVLQPPAIPPHPPKPIALTQNQLSEKLICSPPISVTSPTVTITITGPTSAGTTTAAAVMNSKTANSHNIPSSILTHNLHKDITQKSKEEIELVTPTKTKSLTLKKKNSLLAKRRKISLKMLGISDIQGHLYRRTKDKRGVTFWAKLYFVLIENVLYGFRSKDAQKANCMIILPGFTVSLASEVHSKPFSFKVYHPAKTFYFATESVEALNQWMDFIRKATFTDKTNNNLTVSTPSSSAADILTEINIKDFFSETESSDDENNDSLFIKQQSLFTSSLNPNQNNEFRNENQRVITSETPPSKHDKYLSSLKIFTKSSLPSFKSEKKSSSDVPIPTAKFRSYRKVPGGSYGLQIGTNSSLMCQNENLNPNQLLSTTIYNSDYGNKKQHVINNSSVKVNTDGTNKISTSLESEESYNNSINSSYRQQHHYQRNENHINNHNDDKPRKIRKTSPYNYIHASNPNLVEFDFQTSKTLDFSIPKINSSNSWDAHSSISGFVTLKDLMLQKQKEEAQEMYNNRVFLGVEKKDDRNSTKLLTSSRKNFHDNAGNGTNPAGREKLSKIQSRSLPKTPDYEMSFKPDDEDIKRTRTKEGLKLRDFGYEFIYGDEPSTVENSNQGYQSQTMPKKKHSSHSCSENVHHHSHHQHQQQQHQHNQQHSSRGGSFKKTTKGKFEAFKTSSERLFQFKHSNSESASLKSSTTYTPLTLPLNKKSTQLFIQLDPNFSQQTNLKKSQTSHFFASDSSAPSSIITSSSTIKDKKFEAPRKNSAPVPIFSKFTFSTGNKTAKEKKLLGSPRLHRAIFGSGSGRITSTGSASTSRTDLDHEIFSPIVFPKLSSQQSHQSPSDQNGSSSTTATSSSSPPSTTTVTTAAATTTTESTQNTPTIVSNSGTINSPDYPNMECPPVFEPEIYSLSDPNASLTLLRRRKNLEE